MILCYDTETTGFPHDNLPVDHPQQPHLVQLAAILYEYSGRERASINLIIRPDGYTIPEVAAKVHGITTEIAMACGVPLMLAVGAFVNLRAVANEIVAHNAPFDGKIMRTAIARTGRTPTSAGPTKVTCTCDLATPIVNLPPTAKMLAAGFNKPKAPKLEECIRHFFNEDLDGAHDALVDARACARIFFHMRALEAPPATL